ncbi:MAG: hypothetical protein GY765_28985, partial [bacterium]|nr:hypothetical protein [bacterium]
MIEEDEIRSVRSICEDREGNLWLGTFRGLYCLTEAKFSIFNRRGGLPTDLIRTVFEGRDGTTWIGTFGHGVLRIKNGEIQPLEFGNQLRYRQVFAMAESPDGTIWVGLNGGGIFSWKNGEFQLYNRKTGLVDNSVRAIWIDESNRTWVGTNNGISIIEEGRIINNFSDSDGLADNYIYALRGDNRGNIWIGGRKGGLSLYKDGKFKVLGRDAGLKDVGIWTIYPDTGGYVWLGTNGLGLMCLKDEKATFITMKHGMYDDLTFQVVEDKKRQFWMNCNRGIYKVGREDLLKVVNGKSNRVSCVSYGEREGISQTETSGPGQPGAWLDRAGKVWFAGRKGVVVFDPDHIPKNPILPPVLVESLHTGSGSYTGKSIEIPAGNDKIEIHYTALSLRMPEMVIFKYRLKGVDTKWIDAGKRRAAYYTNLTPGHYTFQVTACNSDGLWSETGATANIYLTPFFYQSWWFYGLCFLLVAALAFMGYRIRVDKLKQRELQLQHLVEEQTAHLKDRTRELETIDKIVKTINRHMDLDSVLDSMLKQALLLIPRADMGL